MASRHVGFVRFPDAGCSGKVTDRHHDLEKPEMPTAGRRNWRCPACGSKWGLPASVPDPDVCPRCRDAGINLSLGPDHPVVDEPALPELPVQPLVLRRPQPTSFLAVVFELFDWKFQSYLTPLIVKFTWVCCVGLFILSLTVGLVDFAFGIVTNTSLAKAIEDWLDTPQPLNERNRAGGPKIRFRDSEQAAAATRLIVGTVAAVFLLLYTRVFFEFAIVSFDIAGRLSRIEERTRRMGADGDQPPT